MWQLFGEIILKFSKIGVKIRENNLSQSLANWEKIRRNNFLQFHKDWDKIRGNNFLQFHKDWDKIREK
jgi:hypothetical protein